MIFLINLGIGFKSFFVLMLVFCLPSLSENLKIPKERIAVLIGKKGSVKKRIEELASVKIEIDSKTGSVSVQPKGKQQENFLSAINIVKAIARGFSPENALLLLDEENFLTIIDLKEFGKTEKSRLSKKGRVIGTEGKVRERIEEETETKISVFGKTISIIGRIESMERARKAIEMLLSGARHETIFKFLRESSFEKTKFEL